MAVTRMIAETFPVVLSCRLESTAKRIMIAQPATIVP
ncbi:hypothetical protein ATK23_2468 [Glutamicibacter mysorens]|uniref:Uncharacterized protein n=1 Tax=Glutamicibacter mysorens TaxID=257984 RepID=A0ABX4N071_9MICC|nr:hypothetical protein ATK23_2468 [Glutamicibacter mysorens]